MKLVRSLISATAARIGERVLVSGFVHVRRDHGKLIFLDLRDETGLLQIVCKPNIPELARAKDIRSEWVVEIQGIVQARPKGTENAELLTGSVELVAEELLILSEAHTPPFEIAVADTEAMNVNEELRLRYRYLDIRRLDMSARLRLRAKAAQFMRTFLSDKGFLEVETPLLTRSTPEGARDFLVPSRKEPGRFFALPQSPQQYKQLLMVGGIGRYFQFARALRDEDTRGDRQPEHTQLDIEMSHVTREDVMNTAEELATALVDQLFPKKQIIQKPFPRMTFDDAMAKYQTDRPDLRKDPGDSKELAFTWVVDFPMFEWNDTERRWSAMHNPFGMPVPREASQIKKDPSAVRSLQYDLVLNGLEIAGGSIRAHDPNILRSTFEVLGHDAAEIEEQFGHMLEAFSFGAPPHGGIAFGFDRFMMALCNMPNIREVIAFPKTGDGKDPLMHTPASVADVQLRELGLEIRKEKK